MNTPLLSLIQVNKFYDEIQALHDVSLDIKHGEFLTLLGPSGCGKTTLLRCIAGLERVDSGDILLNGRSIKDLAPNKRNLNTVFQNYALFPHLNVYDNVAYGPRVKKTLAAEELKARIGDVLELVQMSGYEKRMPHQLSGGQRQRIAIARALINEPAILLLDEPLGALDLKLRKHMQSELTGLQKQTGTTFVYVTHDQEEALNMSDRIAVMEEGVLLQLGTPREIYNNPRNLFVADFIGERNMLRARLVQVGEHRSTVKVGEDVVEVRNLQHCLLQTAKDAILAVHRDKMRIFCEPVPNALLGQVVSIHYAGSQIRIEVMVGAQHVTVVEYQKNECQCKVGEQVYLTWEDGGAILLPPEEAWTERAVGYAKA